MEPKKSAKTPVFESVERIEPARLEQIPEDISNLIAELSAISARLGRNLNPQTATQLSDLVRITNTYYSNLIEGHNTRPKDIERALAGEMDANPERRNLQIEAKAHIKVQAEIDHLATENLLPEPASVDFIRYLHRTFYQNATPEMLLIRGANREFLMQPGEWRRNTEEDVTVGRHHPPSSQRVEEFMRYFAWRYHFETLGMAGRILAMATAHHRFNYIHPFPDGNGRVSRLMSHAMAHAAGIGAHGLWSISRGLARGLKSRDEYKKMMDYADTPRQGDIDGRGNLSQRALVDFVRWFLEVCIDQLQCMSNLFEFETLVARLQKYVRQNTNLQPEAANILEEALLRGQLNRGEISRITGLPERTARRVLNEVLETGLLGSTTPKGPLSLRFPVDSLDILFPHLF